MYALFLFWVFSFFDILRCPRTIVVMIEAVELLIGQTTIKADQLHFDTEQPDHDIHFCHAVAQVELLSPLADLLIVRFFVGTFNLTE